MRAVKGMIAEKSGIFMSFIMCLIAFQFMTLAVTWVSYFFDTSQESILCKVFNFKVMMETYSSAVSTIILTVGALYWYKYCLRIYNR